MSYLTTLFAGAFLMAFVKEKDDGWRFGTLIFAMFMLIATGALISQGH